MDACIVCRWSFIVCMLQGIVALMVGLMARFKCFKCRNHQLESYSFYLTISPSFATTAASRVRLIGTICKTEESIKDRN